jgi:hypothetical protein
MAEVKAIKWSSASQRNEIESPEGSRLITKFDGLMNIAMDHTFGNADLLVLTDHLLWRLHPRTGNLIDKLFFFALSPSGDHSLTVTPKSMITEHKTLVCSFKGMSLGDLRSITVSNSML